MKLMSPLVSGVAVLMVRQLMNRKERGVMTTAIQPRPNMRSVRKSQQEVRADRVKGTLDSYRVAGLREPGASLDTVISEFLSDLRHLCDRAKLDLSQVDRVAHRNYLNEKFAR